eukprot:scaffold32363_cov112-Isochrysis_galbana.AAC.2
MLASRARPGREGIGRVSSMSTRLGGLRWGELKVGGWRWARGGRRGGRPPRVGRAGQARTPDAAQCPPVQQMHNEPRLTLASA